MPLAARVDARATRAGNVRARAGRPRSDGTRAATRGSTDAALRPSTSSSSSGSGGRKPGTPGTLLGTTGTSLRPARPRGGERDTGVDFVNQFMRDELRIRSSTRSSPPAARRWCSGSPSISEALPGYASTLPPRQSASRRQLAHPRARDDRDPALLDGRFHAAQCTQTWRMTMMTGMPGSARSFRSR